MPNAAGAVLAAAVLLAWALDRAFGEPPDRLHPVAWLGRAMQPLGVWLRDRPPRVALAGGSLVWVGGAALVAGTAVWLQALLWSLHPLVALFGIALLLKPAFAWRMLRDEVRGVEAALSGAAVDVATGAQPAGEDAAARALAAGRQRLARLVSRDVRDADAGAVREAAIETLAENLNDAVVAPLFWFVVAGLPGAWVYRYANTLDAMWGYRGRWEYAGRCSARADDLLSWLPARLTAWLLYPRVRGAALRAEAARTTSPNGGWPMGALALRLGVRLGKPGVYVLNAAGRTPAAGDVQAALAASGRAATMALLLATAGVALTGGGVGRLPAGSVEQPVVADVSGPVSGSRAAA